MKKCLFIAPMVALSLSGCGLAQRAITAPGQVAQHTAVDEQALKRCEQTYKLTRVATEALVDGGLLVGMRAVTAARIDMEAYGLLIGCRTAYRLFNTTELIRVADEMDVKSNEATTASKGAE